MVRWEPIVMVGNLSRRVETQRLKTNAEDG